MDGTELWTRQFGTSAFDAAFGISVDAFAVYVVGMTVGTLPGQTSAGGQDVFIVKLVERPMVEGVDVGTDLKSLIVQLNDDDLDAVQAINADNYHVIAANGDANGDGDFFNDGDELERAIDSIVYDSVADQVTLQMAEALADEVFRLEIDGDDATSDGTSGLTDLAGNFLSGGDFSIDLDLTCLSLLDELIGKVEALGLDTGVENSLVGKLDAALHLLGIDPATNTGILAKMDAFIKGVHHWFDRDEITAEEHDELTDDANFLVLCIMLSEEEAVS